MYYKPSIDNIREVRAKILLQTQLGREPTSKELLSAIRQLRIWDERSSRKLSQEESRLIDDLENEDDTTMDKKTNPSIIEYDNIKELRRNYIDDPDKMKQYLRKKSKKSIPKPKRCSCKKK